MLWCVYISFAQTNSHFAANPIENLRPNQLTIASVNETANNTLRLFSLLPQFLLPRFDSFAAVDSSTSSVSECVQILFVFF